MRTIQMKISASGFAKNALRELGRIQAELKRGLPCPECNKADDGGKNGK